MVRKAYTWETGAELGEHSKRKHKILREYIAQYLAVRCNHPQQPRFRFSVVEGFSGAGKYACGTAGSPLIFIEQIKTASEQINISRATQGLKPIHIECELILNDLDASAINLLKENVSTLLADISDKYPYLSIKTTYLNKPFEEAYLDIIEILNSLKIKNVLFNLDQYGHSYVNRKTISDMVSRFQSEIFYTFSIQSFMSFLSKTNSKLLKTQLSFLDLSVDEIIKLNFPMSTEKWLGAAERMVFQAFNECAPYVSPFSIHNPSGWRYWLIHFAKSYRARQVYNNILHNNSTSQAHFGRAGLNMLTYDARHEEGSLYLFDIDGRKSAVDQLRDDIPKLLHKTNDGMTVLNFYETIYNLTPAHSEDIKSSLLQSPDLKVITKSGGNRRRPNSISAEDIIILNNQRSIFSLL